MASTEEKLLTLLLSVEHLQHTAMEQQKAVADWYSLMELSTFTSVRWSVHGVA